MPRRIPLRKGNLYHIYNRGVDHKKICLCQADYFRLISTFQHYAEEEKVPLHAWCVIANHYHMIGEQKTEVPLSKMMQRTFISYTRYFNTKYNRKGPLFESRFVSRLIRDQRYYRNVIKYVEHNAVRHNIVTDARDWPFSSLSTGVVSERAPDKFTLDEEIAELEQLCAPEIR